MAIITKQYKVVFLESKDEMNNSDNNESFNKTGRSNTSNIWEQNILYGQKNNFNKSFSLTLLEFPIKTEVLQISIGLSHCVLIDREYKAYSFGDNSMKQLGLKVFL